MPVHDWTRVDDGIFHDFHHEWISTIRRALNGGLLPADYYALAEQQAAGFGPDVLTPQTAAVDPADEGESPAPSSGLLLAAPPVRITAESAGTFYRRKKSTIVIRHVTGDRIVAVVEVVSPGNIATRNPFKALIDKACELLEHKIICSSWTFCHRPDVTPTASMARYGKRSPTRHSRCRQTSR